MFMHFINTGYLSESGIAGKKVETKAKLQDPGFVWLKKVNLEMLCHSICEIVNFFLRDVKKANNTYIYSYIYIYMGKLSEHNEFRF